MKKQQRLIFLLLFTCFAQVHCVIVAHLNTIPPGKKNPSSSNCFTVENDEDVVTSREFNISRNPNHSNSQSNYIKDDNDHIVYLKIVDKKSIPLMIFGLRYLERLEIRNSRFSLSNDKQIPSEIECLASSLIELSISDTKITHLPNEISKLKRLRTLKLSNTGLSYLPDFIDDLSSLAILYLPHNNLESLPVTMKNLRSLKQITLSNNPFLRSIQPLNGLPALRILDTRHCSIEILPRNLPQLTNLYMSNNALTKLTGIERFGYKTNSKKFFWFDNNYIKSVSPRIHQVKNLYQLDLSNNRLATLSPDICNISTLQQLFLQNNCFNDKEIQSSCIKSHILFQ